MNMQFLSGDEKYYSSALSSTLYRIIDTRTENDGTVSGLLEALTPEGIAYVVVTRLTHSPNSTRLSWDSLSSYHEKKDAHFEFEYLKVRTTGEQKISRHISRKR